MAPSLLARLLDRGRAGAQRLGGRPIQTKAPAERALSAPRAPQSAEDRLEQTATHEEVAALRLALTRELDRLALRESSATPGSHR